MSCWVFPYTCPWKGFGMTSADNWDENWAFSQYLNLGSNTKEGAKSALWLYFFSQVEGRQPQDGWMSCLALMWMQPDVIWVVWLGCNVRNRGCASELPGESFSSPPNKFFGNLRVLLGGTWAPVALQIPWVIVLCSGWATALGRIAILPCLVICLASDSGCRLN